MLLRAILIVGLIIFVAWLIGGLMRDRTRK
jgi:flagellar biogenesis protein FliO